MQGGVLLKLMDNAAGVCSAKYCHSNVVTACIETVDFIAPVHSGELVYVRARPIFTSQRSLEVEVLVEVENLHGHRQPGVRLTAQYTAQRYVHNTFITLQLFAAISSHSLQI